MTDLKLLAQKNAQRWSLMSIVPGLVSIINKVSQRLSAPTAKARYMEVSKSTGVPWEVIAVIHERESGQDWDTSLAQGDPWDRPSTHVPRGRGPFSSWAEAAIDALIVCPPKAGSWHDWSIGGTLTLLEQYNGLGYANGPVDHRVDPPTKYPSQPSPYIWAGTNQYAHGKYIADGVFDQNHIDKQLGCAALLKTMEYVAKILQPVIQPPVLTPEPVPYSFVQTVIGFISKLFRRF